MEEFEKLDLRYKESEAKISQLKIAISERNARRHRLNMVIEKLYSMGDILTEFDETTWNTLVESAAVHKKGKITFLFRDGSKKTVVIPDTSTAKL